MSKEIISTIKGNIENVAHKASLIPDEAYQRMGCTFCEWRRVPGKCPNTTRDEVTDEIKFTPPKDNICSKRVGLMIQLTPDYKEKPTMDKWALDFNKALGHVKFLDQKNVVEILKEKLEVLESDPEHDTHKAQNLLFRLEKQQFFELSWFKEVTKLLDAKENRDTVKKLDIGVTKMKPSDIAQLLYDAQDEVIDAEIVEEDDD